MSKRDTTRRSVRCLFLIRRYIIFFLLMAFVITCCMILFLNMMTRTTGLELTQEHIEQAAKVTFLNVLLLSLLCTIIDGIRRRFMVKRPVQKIVNAGPLRKFCVSVFRQNQEYHIINVHDWGLFPLATAFPGGWDGMRALRGVNAVPASRES